MASIITSPADVVNLALSNIGRRDRIGSIYEGSATAKAALDLYSQTRDAVLRSFEWGFAEKIAAAVVSGQAAPAPWSVSYGYPADCLKLRDMFNATYLADKNNPLPVLWTIANNTTVGKIILCNSAAATLVYTAQITNPVQWEPLFVDAFADQLGRAMAPALASLDAAKLLGEEVKADMPLAAGTVG